MRVGWLIDEQEYVGGAEITQDEFRRAAPDGVLIFECPPGAVDPGCDVYAIHNCVLYSTDDLEPLAGKRIVKYWNDVGPWLKPDVREWLDAYTMPVYCSPLQAQYMGNPGGTCIPPAVDLARFEHAAEVVNGDRRGTVSIGSWRNAGKGVLRVVEWASENGGVEFFGDGPFAPPGAKPVAYQHMPALLASYERFVFLPTVIEPFGRLVIEAWAAGCELVINDLVGAKWWIENDPAAVTFAGDNFWALFE